MSSFSAERIVVKANSYVKKGKIDEACELYIKVLDTFPENRSAMQGLINSHEVLVSKHIKTIWSMRRSGQRETILEHAKILAKKFTHSFSLWNLLGVLFHDNGFLDPSIECYEKALNIHPGCAAVHNNMGNTLKDRGDLDNAVKSYGQAIKIAKNNANTHNNLGLALMQKGDLKASIASYSKAIKISPNNSNLYTNMGNAEVSALNINAALKSYRKALQIKPDNAVANHMLAALTGITPDVASKEFVENLFDAYAPSFEESLVNKLQYAVPPALAKVAIEHQSQKTFGTVLDLGCGTGLMGLELRGLTQRLEGIDLSSKMLQQAKSKKIYDRLIHGDFIEFLTSAELNFNYYFAADVFIYIGNLFKIFSLIKDRNKEGGKLIFSTEHSEKDGFFLEQSGRYSHSKSYIQAICEELDYKVIHYSLIDLRKEREKVISGGIYLLDF
jgi:predicted TPR repeat methyltransferase